MSSYFRNLSNLTNMQQLVVCFIVVTPFYFAIKYWYVTVFVLLTILVLATIWYVSRFIAKDNRAIAHRRAAIIARAEQQHAAIMRGDMHLGIHGKYPPAIVTAATPYAVPEPVPYRPRS
jgi:uncharacterized membrane protein